MRDTGDCKLDLMIAASNLQGCDCLGYIKYFDAHFTNFHGEVETVKNCVCMHEEDHGIMWKHQDWRTGFEEVRRSRRLTVSFFCTVANYEYGFYWHFYQVSWCDWFLSSCSSANHLVRSIVKSNLFSMNSLYKEQG